VLHPAGTLSLTGFSQTVTFYKRAMDTLGVNVDLVRIAEFKGAMEPFIMNEQSPPVRENKNALLDDVFQRLLAAVARARTSGWPRPGRGARARADRSRPVHAHRGPAGGAGRRRQGRRGARGVPAPGPWPPRIAIRDRIPRRCRSPGRHARSPSCWRRRDHRRGEPPAALRPGDFTGSDTLVGRHGRVPARTGRWAPSCWRVNSPGGSAFASDVVARAITRLRKAGKPVVVSMGDIAASGGYYISAPADVIFAEPSTLSGSIGIFGYKVDVRKLMARWASRPRRTGAACTPTTFAVPALDRR